MPILDNLSHSGFYGASFMDMSQIAYNNIYNHNYQPSNPIREIQAFIPPGSRHDSYKRRRATPTCSPQNLKEIYQPYTQPASPNNYIRRLDARISQLEVHFKFLFALEDTNQKLAPEFANYLDRSEQLVAAYLNESYSAQDLEVEDLRKNFFPSIVSQLAVHFPQIIPQFEEILRRDPSILHKSIDTQCEKLIIEPFKRLLDFKKTPQYIVLGNFLDYDNRADAIDILNVLGHALKQLPFPIQVVVFAKSSDGIKAAMNDPFLKEISCTLDLAEDHEFRNSSDLSDVDEDNMDVCEN